MLCLSRAWPLIVLTALVQSRLINARALMSTIWDQDHRYDKPRLHPNARSVRTTENDQVPDGQQPEYFSNNTLETVFKDNRVKARIDSAVLDGNKLSMSGVVTYIQISKHPNITDEADMVGKSGSSALILQAELDGETLKIMWMKRSCACSTDARFVIASAKDGDELWVAGSTTGIDLGADTKTGEGMALMRYNSQGTQLLLRQTGAAGEKYEWVGFTMKAVNESRNVTLVGTVNSERFEGMQNALVAQIANETGDIVQTFRISDGEDVVGETFWNAESMNGMLYVAGKRIIHKDLSPRSALTLTKIDTEKMEQVGSREFDNELQRGMVLCADDEGVTASYVARNNNQGRVIVNEMDDKLDNVMRTEVKIQRDPIYQKAVRSAMVACDATKSPPVLLMNTAEALNQTAPDWETKRKLNNQRPALLTVESKTFQSISQSQRSIEWVASGMLNRDGGDNWIIYGKTGNGKPLVSNGYLPKPKKVVPTPSPSPDITTTGAACIGDQTRIDGKAVTELIGARRAMRLQRHPLRRRRHGDALCRRAGGDVLCATAQHVVLVGEETLFMREWCERTRDCEVRRQRLLNFKAPCGVTLPPAADGARLTMHSGDAPSALSVVRAECHLQTRSVLHRAWWRLTTL